MLDIGTVLQNRYRVVVPLGQGGMGAVYQAWDNRLQVSVAVKEMTPQSELEPTLLAQLRQQFEQEAVTLARLNYPNLVRVMDFFEERANAYLVMNFVEGESLAARITRVGALPEAKVLSWANVLLGALSYCHQQKVIHRDIKPENVILQPDDQPILVDFGLVKLWDPKDPRTRTAMRGMGSPEYAPPEQYSVRNQHTDPRTDLYGLGATLYHALTGQAPLSATDRMAMPESFLRPMQIIPKLSLHMEKAILRAMALQLDRRWRDAETMQKALQGIEPSNVVASPSLLLGSEVSVLDQLLQQQMAQRLWEEAERTAQAIQLLRPDYDGIATLLQQIQDNRAGRQEAETLWQQLDEHLTEDETEHHRTERELESQAGTVEEDYAQLTNRQIALQEQRDNLQAQLAAVEDELASLGVQLEEAKIKQEDLHAQKTALRHTAQKLVERRAALAEAKQRLDQGQYQDARQMLRWIKSQGIRQVRGGENKRAITEKNIAQLVERYRLKHPRCPGKKQRLGQTVYQVAFCPCIAETHAWRLASATEGGQVWFWKLPDLPFTALKAHDEKSIQALAFSPNGEFIASGVQDERVRLWRVADRQALSSPLEHASKVGGMVFSPDSAVLATGAFSGDINFWRVSDGKLLRTIKSYAGAIKSIDLSSDGNLLAIGTGLGKVQIIQISNDKPLATLKGGKFESWIYSVAFSPDSMMLAASSVDGPVHLWRLTEGNEQIVLEGHTDSVFCVSFSPDGALLASASYDKTLRLWRVSDGMLLHTLEHPAVVYGVSFSPDGDLLASASRDSVVRIWGLPDDTVL